MQSLENVLDPRKSLSGKLISIILAFVLAFSFSNLFYASDALAANDNAGSPNLDYYHSPGDSKYKAHENHSGFTSYTGKTPTSPSYDGAKTNGNHAIYYCPEHNLYLIPESLTPEHEHFWNEGVVTADPTCIKEGEKTYTCTACNETKTESIPVDTENGHNYKAVVTKPTCIRGGYTTHTCEYCGHEYVTDKVSALDHDWDKGTVTKEPSCKEAGLKFFTCSRCDATKTEPIPVDTENGHNYKAVVTKPNCTDDGYTTYTCTICENSKKVVDEDSALGHAWGEWDVTEPATCTATGTKKHVCTRDNCDAFETETIPMIAHNADGKVEHKDPTCAETGVVGGTYCTACNEGKEAAEKTIPATGDHDFSIWVIDEDTPNNEAPNCSRGGFVYYKAYCKVCGLQDDRIHKSYDPNWDLDNHNYVASTVAPTCEDDGYTVYTCTRNSAHTYTVVDEGSANGHSYEAVVTNPTCVDAGYTTYTCTVCGHEYTDDETEALGHTEEAIPAVAATCEDAGLTAGVKCSVCDEILTPQTNVPALGHAYGDWVVVTPATVDSAGLERRVCANDATHTEERTIARLTAPVINDQQGGNAQGGDTPQPPTPVATTIDDDATPLAAPVVADDGDDAADDAATIDDNPNPLAETPETTIDDDATPMGAFDQPVCWTHTLMLIGIILTLIYGAVVVARRLGYSNEIEKMDKNITGSQRTTRTPSHVRGVQGA